MPGNPHPRVEFLELGKWKKGQSGNPKGKPKGAKSLTSTLKELLEREIKLPEHPITKDPNVKLTLREMLMLSLLKNGVMKGDLDSIKEIFDRIEGKVPLPMEHTGVNLQLAAMVEMIKDPKKLIEGAKQIEDGIGPGTD